MPESPRLSRAILAASLFSLLVSAALAFDLSPLLRGGAGWRWPYEVPAQPLRLLPGALALIAYLGLGGWWLARLEKSKYSPRQDWSFVAACWLGGLIVQLALLSFYGQPFQQMYLRTISIASGGFFNVAAEITDLGQTLRSYPALMPTWTAHPKAHPPGWVLFFLAGEGVFGAMPPLAKAAADTFRAWQCHHRLIVGLDNAGLAAAGLGYLYPVIGAVAVFPAYGLMRRLYDRETGMRAALWMPLIPAMLMFTPQPNQAYAPLMLGVLWLWHEALAGRGEEGPSPLMFLWAGLLLSLGTYLSFTNLAMFGVLGVYAAVYYGVVARHEWIASDWRQLGLGLALFGLGTASVWVVHFALTGVTPFQMLQVALGLHFGFSKPYLPWLFFHPWDVMLFSGLVLATLAGFEAVRAARDLYDYIRTPQQRLVLPLATAISFAGLAGLGVVRGEVGRLLLGLMPLIVLVAAHGVQVRKNHVLDNLLPSLALGAQVLVMVAVLRVLGTELAPAPASAAYTGQPGADASAVGARFEAEPGAAELAAFTASRAPGYIDLHLYWRPLSRFEGYYLAFGLAVDEAGAPVAEQNWLPIDGQYLTTCWQPGQQLEEQVRLPLRDAPPGPLWISLALFDEDSGARLPVALPDGTISDQVGLGPIE